MNGNERARGAWIAWRTFARAHWGEHPMQLLATVTAIALGVALGVAVYLVNSAALDEFDQATRRLLGAADIIVRGPPEGFDETLLLALAHQPAVATASPMLELELTRPGRAAPLKLLALDPFRAAALQPQLMAAIGTDVTRLFAPDSIVLSRAAANELQLQRGDELPIVVGGARKSLHVIDILPDGVYPEALGIMDIATAQWSLQLIGRLNRIDLRARPGIDLAALRDRLASTLPAGVVAVTPAIDRGRAANATRAYRVNLNMLALVALLTGAFLVFATQSLAVLRRRAALGLLRALGVTRLSLECALLGEGAAIGLAGSLLGALLGAAIAALVLRFLGSDLGNRALAARAVVLALPALPMAAFVLIGTAVSGLGAWIPAHEAAQRAPALAMKSGDCELAVIRLPGALPGLALIAAGALLAWLPPVNRLPLPGYVAIAALLAGAILLIPTLMRRVTGSAKRSGRATFDIAVAQLQGSAGVSTISLAAIIVSFSLMVAMAIMVHSFRDSFELWLVKLLPADLQLRVSVDSDTGALTGEQQHRIAALPGVARAEFRRVRQICLSADRAAGDADCARYQSAARRGHAAVGAWHAARRFRQGPRPPGFPNRSQDRYGYRPASGLPLPLEGRLLPLFDRRCVARLRHAPAGAIVIARADYIAATGDAAPTKARSGSDHRPRRDTEAAIRASSNMGTRELSTAPTARAFADASSIAPSRSPMRSKP